MSDTNHGNAKNNHYVWQFVTKSWQSMRRVLLVIYKVVIEFKWKFSFKMCDFKMEKIWLSFTINFSHVAFLLLEDYTGI